MRAPDAPTQVVGEIVVTVTNAGAELSERVLHLLKRLPIHNGFVCIILAPFAEGQNTQVNLIHQKIFNDGCHPFAVSHRQQIDTDRSQRSFFQVEVEGMAHDFCLVWVGYKPLRRLLIAAGETGPYNWLLTIAERDCAAAEITFGDHLLHLGSGPLAHLLRIHAIKKNGHFLVHVPHHVIRVVLAGPLNGYTTFVQHVFGDIILGSPRQAAHVGNNHSID